VLALGVEFARVVRLQDVIGERRVLLRVGLVGHGEDQIEAGDQCGL